jgi:hypothetical protein
MFCGEVTRHAIAAAPTSLLLLRDSRKKIVRVCSRCVGSYIPRAANRT